MRALLRLIAVVRRIVRKSKKDLRLEYGHIDDSEEVVERILGLQRRLRSTLTQENRVIEKMYQKYQKKGLDFQDFPDYLLKQLNKKGQLDKQIEAVSTKACTQAMGRFSDYTMSMADSETRYYGLSSDTHEWASREAAIVGKKMREAYYAEVMAQVRKAVADGVTGDSFFQGFRKRHFAIDQVLRDIATEEIMKSHGRAQYEAYKQSPAIVAKKWRHRVSGKGISRSAHLRLADEPAIGIDEDFIVNGHRAKYPRDPALPDGERINCRCTMEGIKSPDVHTQGDEDREERQVKHYQRMLTMKVIPDIEQWHDRPILPKVPESYERLFIPSSEFIRDFEEYQAKIEQITGRKIPEKQAALVRAAIESRQFTQQPKAVTDEHRAEFDRLKKGKNGLIKQWERETRQEWPTYDEDLHKETDVEKKDEPLRKKGQLYDAHHLIECSYGGPNRWWNIHPAKFPSEHQDAIHGGGGAAEKIFPDTK